MIRMFGIVCSCIVIVIVPIFVCGCIGQSVILHPITPSDIFGIEKGAIIKSPTGQEIKVEKEGWFLSSMYLNEVAKARVK